VSYEQIALTLRVSPEREVTLGVFDTRHRWSDTVPSVSPPRWIVGPPDWKSLVDLFDVPGFVLTDEASSD
jgi:hypothetical protein